MTHYHHIYRFTVYGTIFLLSPHIFSANVTTLPEAPVTQQLPALIQNKRQRPPTVSQGTPAQGTPRVAGIPVQPWQRRRNPQASTAPTPYSPTAAPTAITGNQHINNIPTPPSGITVHNTSDVPLSVRFETLNNPAVIEPIERGKSKLINYKPGTIPIYSFEDGGENHQITPDMISGGIVNIKPPVVTTPSTAPRSSAPPTARPIQLAKATSLPTPMALSSPPAPLPPRPMTQAAASSKPAGYKQSYP